MFAALIFCHAESSAAIISNGGFEAPSVSGSQTFTSGVDFTSWDVVTGTVTLFNSSNAFEGSQYAQLDADDSILQQNFATEAGKTYAISFAYSGPDTANMTLAIADVVGNNGLFVATIGGTTPFDWMVFTTTFTAASDTSAVIFLTGSIGGSGMLIDDVHIVPEPSSIVVGIGFLGLAAASRLRKRAYAGITTQA